MARRGAICTCLVVMIMALAALLRPAAAADFTRLPAAPQLVLQKGEISLLAKTAYFEARGDGALGMLSVCFVVLNRLKQQPEYFGSTISQVVRRPAQFSVWSPGARRGGAKARVDVQDPFYVLALWAALTAITDASSDPTKGATYFFARTMSPPPAWVRGKVITARIGGHVFLTEPHHD